MTTASNGLRTHPLDPRVRISDDLADLAALVPGKTKLVEVFNSVAPELHDLACALSDEEKASLKKAWDSPTQIIFEPGNPEPIHKDYGGGKIVDKIKAVTPEPLYEDILSMSRLHNRLYGSDYLEVNMLSFTRMPNATYGFHWDTSSSHAHEHIRMGRLYQGTASEWLAVSKDFDKAEYTKMRQKTEGNVYRKLRDENGALMPTETLSELSTAVWRGLSETHSDRNTGLFHRRIEDMSNRLVIVMDGWITPPPGFD